MNQADIFAILTVFVGTVVFISSFSGKLNPVQFTLLPYRTSMRLVPGVNHVNNTRLKRAYGIQLFNRTEHVELSPQKRLKVLYWTLGQYPGYGAKRVTYRDCGVSNCIGTSNKAEYNSSDAVVFNVWYNQPKSPGAISLPSYRPPGQKWIFVSQESPTKTSLCLQPFSNYNDMFNATWSYHRKSEIVGNYSMGFFRKLEHPKNLSVNYAKGKVKTVAAFISNCKTTSSRRLAYVKNLQKHIPIDVYGKCGNLSCSKTSEGACMKILNEKYKFYLAFENSICQDYITEKVWKILTNPSMNVIPVILGGGKYSKVLPPGSYLDVGNFTNPKALAEHMQRIDQDDNLFNSYFKWREHYVFQHAISVQCQLCKYLHETRNKVKTIPRMDLFWNNSTDCYDPRAYYKHVEISSWL